MRPSITRKRQNIIRLAIMKKALITIAHAHHLHAEHHHHEAAKAHHKTHGTKA